MSKVWISFLYGLFWVLTLPPLVLLYPAANAISWFLHHITKYRLSIIRNNLGKSFPEKSRDEIRQIEKEYYHWLGRLMVESFKVMHWSPEQLAKRVEVINPEILEFYAEKSQDIILLAAHTGNWEWSPGGICQYGFDVLGVYKPQSSKIFDQLIRLIRQKPNVLPIPMKGTMRALNERSKHIRPRALLLIADQTPALGDIHYWTDFLHQDTAWFTGAEKIAKRQKMPVLYLKMTQSKPGYYRCEYLPLAENGDGFASGQLTNFFVHALEQTIINQPAYWLWSHRRWKHHR